MQPLVPNRLFISGAGGKGGEGQVGGSVLETLLSLLLSEKAGINVQEGATVSKPLEEFIRQFTSKESVDTARGTKKTAANAQPDKNADVA